MKSKGLPVPSALHSPLVLVPAGVLAVLAMITVYASPYLVGRYHVQQTFREPDRYIEPLDWAEFESLTWWRRLKHLHVRLRTTVDAVDVNADSLLRTTPDRLSHLAGLPGLQKVSLSDGRFTADDFRELARIDGLQALVIYFRAETDLEAFRELSGHEHLQEIRLDSAGAVGGRLPLIDLPRLRVLRVQSFPLRDVEFERLPRLSLVSIKSSPFTDAGVAHLEPVAGTLRRLELPATQVTAASVPHLLALEQLDTLDLRHLPQSERGADGWTAADFTRLGTHPSLRRILLRPYSDKDLPPEAAGLQRVQAL